MKLELREKNLNLESCIFLIKGKKNTKIPERQIQKKKKRW